ncbi:hypothetical protein [Winogradskya humida]|uniref:Uncharacterized protein n=1 Tax=Winogradskya humida TaxID=113566 RepID=A0ABQ3ZI14_9ACTN|nr:hypothetical protein [Actinoplanes humidus]GIE17887.1 hypothetical protein Ahu01nite_009890 [Actinoplanes humidus]
MRPSSIARLPARAVLLLPGLLPVLLAALLAGLLPVLLAALLAALAPRPRLAGAVLLTRRSLLVSRVTLPTSSGGRRSPLPAVRPGAIPTVPHHDNRRPGQHQRNSHNPGPDQPPPPRHPITGDTIALIRYVALLCMLHPRQNPPSILTPTDTLAVKCPGSVPRPRADATRPHPPERPRTVAIGGIAARGAKVVLRITGRPAAGRPTTHEHRRGLPPRRLAIHSPTGMRRRTRPRIERRTHSRPGG